MDRAWTIRLLGRLSAEQGDHTVTRFPTQKTAAMLAYLAYYGTRPHPREELVDLYWQESEPAAGRKSLGMALVSLRKRLEPPGVPPGAVVRSDRVNIQLNPAAFTTDVAQFETKIHDAARCGDVREQVNLLLEALELYQGELLPGYYEDWIVPERTRLNDVYTRALEQIVTLLWQLGDIGRAIDFAHRIVAAAPDREAAYLTLMRLYAEAGRQSEIPRLYAEMERVLHDTLGETPSAAARELADALTHRALVSVPSLASPTITPTDSPPMDSPPLASPPNTRTSKRPRPRIPMQFTSFVGRESELMRLNDLLSPSAANMPAAPRLVTLTGPGGIGKTGLAVKAAEQLVEAFTDAVWFVPLADLTDPRLISGSIVAALELPRSGDVEPLEQVVEYLQALSVERSALRTDSQYSTPNAQRLTPNALLILDNFEQVAAGGSSVVRTLLERVPSLRCLVTSRRALRVAGERAIELSPLPTPVEDQTPSLLIAYDSVKLYRDRAQSVRSDFQVTAANGPAVAELCRCLEGIPLAIELAAARAQSLTPAEIVTRISERFALLTDRRARKGARHGSLWAAIDWSFHLLTPEQQHLFTRLSVFRNGWMVAAAEAVCQEPAALEYLTQLQERSLVLSEQAGSETRFRMLESLRDFAERQLKPAERAKLQQSHANYFLALAEEAAPELRGKAQQTWLDRLEAEHDNLRAALTWCIEDSERASLGLRLAGSLGRFWETRGYLREGRERLAKILKLAQGTGRTAEKAKVLNIAGLLSMHQNDYSTARSHFEESLAIQKELGNRQASAAALNNLGLLAYCQNDYGSASAFHLASLALRREAGDKRGVVDSLCNLGLVADDQGDYSQAECYYQESLTLCRTLGDQGMTAAILINLALLAQNSQNYEKAVALYEESLRISRPLGDRRRIANALNNLGNVRRAQGEYPAARVLLEECLTIQRELGYRRGIASSLTNLGELAWREGAYEQAAAFYRESLETSREMGDRLVIVEALEGMARVVRALNRLQGAARLWGATNTLREALKTPRSPAEQRIRDREMEAIQAALPEEAFAEAWEQGLAITMEEAIEFALQSSGTAEKRG